MTVDELLRLLSHFSPGAHVKVITNGGIFQIADVTVSYRNGAVVLIGDKEERKATNGTTR